MRKILLVSFISLMLSACSIVPVSVPPDKINNINRLSVVSLLGDKIHLKQLGTTVFNNVDNEFSVQDWNLDNNLEKLVKNELTNNKKIQLVDINLDKEKIYSLCNSNNGITSVKYVLKYASEYLKETATSKQIDTLILIGERQEQIPGTYQHFRGFTLYNKSFLSMKLESKLYLSSTVEVIDMQTMQPIARQILFFKEKLDRSYWQEELADYNEEQVEFIKNTLSAKLEKQIPLTIKKFNLLN